MLLNFPPTTNRRAWQKHFGAHGLRGQYYLLYHRYCPRVACVHDGVEGEALRYFSDKTLFSSPPVWVVFYTASNEKLFKYDNGTYSVFDQDIDWHRARQSPPVEMTPKCAAVVVDGIFKDHEQWLVSPLSRAAIGSIPRIFSECTTLVYELIQNAFDASATRVKIELDEKRLKFLHDGYNFSEADANAISFVNLSSKERDKTGFMGIGFKSVFEASSQPEIHSSPFSFLFDNRSEGGYILPKNAPPMEVPQPFTTMFCVPFQDKHIHELIRVELTPEDAKENDLGFSRKTFLHLLKERDGVLTGISFVETPYVQFKIVKGKLANSYRIVDTGRNEASDEKLWLYFETPFRPDKAGIVDFLKNRSIKSEELEREGWDEFISIIIPLARAGSGYCPAKDYAGILNVYLPTKIKTGLGFDIQGNFIISAGRERLRHVLGDWNRELFSHVGELLVKIFDWCRSLKNPSRIDLSAFYSLIPDWENLDFVPDEILENIRSGFVGLFSSQSLIPTGVNGAGRIGFHSPGESIIVDDAVLSLFRTRTIEKLSGKKIALPSLTPEARDKISASCEIEKWGAERTLDLLSTRDWIQYVPKFRSRRQCHRWLSKLYAYLNSFFAGQEYNWELREAKEKILDCCIFPTDWLDAKRRYRFTRSMDRDKKLYRLPREQAALPLDAFKKKIHIVNQGFEDYVRGRAGKMTAEEKASIEAGRAVMEQVGVPVLDPDIIVRDFISPLFDDVSTVGKKTLVEYTSFICEHAKEIQPKSISILLLNGNDEFCPPESLFLGDSYGFSDIGRFFGAAGKGVFLSEEYLKKGSISTEKWVNLFLSLGAKNFLPVNAIKETLHRDRLKERIGEHFSAFEDVSLRQSHISGDFPGNRFFLMGADFADTIKDRLAEIRKMPLVAKKDCMRAFIRILDDHWKAQYSGKLWVRVQYYREYQKRYSPPHDRILRLQSKFAEYLTSHNWVAATNSEDLRMPSQVVAQTEENISLSDEGVVLCEEMVKDSGFLDFLGFKPLPENITNLNRVVNLKNHASENLDKYRELYALINADVAGRKLSVPDVRREFSENSLIYANGKFWKPDQVIFSPPPALRLYLPVLMDVYPDMKDFFCNVLGCDEETHSIEKVLMYFLDFLWVTEKGMDDTLRGSILYCYRRLLDHRAEHEETSYEDSPVWQRFMEECRVFCGRSGWIRSRDEKPVVFLDIFKHEDLFRACEKIHVESHIRQMNRDTIDLMPLLELLNVKAASQSISGTISNTGVHIHENTQGIERNVNSLLDSVIDVLSSKYEDSNKKERTELNKFVDKLREFKGYRKVVYRADTITSTMSLEGEELFTVVKGCHISLEGGMLKIFISDDLMVIYGQLSGELCAVLGTALLPGNIEKVVRLMIDRTVGNIEGDFQRSIEAVYRDLGFGQASEPAPTVDDGGDGHEQAGEDEIGGEPPAPEVPAGREKESYDNVTEPVDYSQVSLATVEDGEASSRGDAGDSGSGGSGGGRMSKRHFHPNPYSEEDGERGEEVALEKEKERLKEIGLDEYVSKIVHISKKRPGHPWDIESFDRMKDSFEVIPIRIEVKATPDPNNLVFPMSEPEFRAALKMEHQKGPYFIYRVFSVRSSAPKIKRYDFHALYHKRQISIKRAKDFFLELPDSDEGESSEE